MRLLLLEDDDRIARDVMATLKAAGYSVERETDGEEGGSKAIPKTTTRSFLTSAFPRSMGSLF
jgi:DNA-binding response OmpR family regulator